MIRGLCRSDLGNVEALVGEAICPAWCGQPAPGGGVQHWIPAPGTSGDATASNSQATYGQWKSSNCRVYPPVFELNVPEQIDPERVI